MSSTTQQIVRLGYVGQNYTYKWTTGHTFVKKSFGKQKIIDVVQKNIDDLKSILEYNVKHGIYFQRLASTFVPFASHELTEELQRESTDKFHWASYFAPQLQKIGKFVLDNNIRISFHPDHFCVLNSHNEDVVKKSVAELEYHALFLDTMFDVDRTKTKDFSQKFQIHVGGLYGDKKTALKRFCDNYKSLLSERAKRRLVIENDDHLFSLEDCIWIHNNVDKQVPILFDTFHHECLNPSNMHQREAILLANSTWNVYNDRLDGPILLDYSSQQPNQRKGKHIDKIDEKHFEELICKNFMFIKDPRAEEEDRYLDFDVMLEIKEKELSAIKAVRIMKPYEKLRQDALDDTSKLPSFDPSYGIKVAVPVSDSEASQSTEQDEDEEDEVSTKKKSKKRSSTGSQNGKNKKRKNSDE